MRQPVLLVAALAAGAAALCSAAIAAIDPGRTVGDWRLSEVGGKVACTLTFTREASFAGYALKAPLACRRAFPALRSVAAWALDDKGGIVLTDANAQTIVTFPAAAAGGSYEAKSPDGRTWRLEPLKSDAAPPSPAPPAKPTG
ncbi:MAG TPA: AprI/Inh family metalloprotease inhibitor [Caulobacteraceae bacterium]|nr:AprI/Inh family metalloprotease inhibitor [Caulobacteraceae bacterium]